MEQFINKLKIELNKGLPGTSAQYEMAPILRPKIKIENLTPNDYKLSAVMILFCVNENNDLFIPLIERIAYNGVHSAQISFPGGKYEDKDLNTLNTAIRECKEEIGISNQIEILGKLTPLFIPVSGFLVEPYIGFINSINPDFSLNAREVKTILNLNVKNLLDDNFKKEGLIEGSNYKSNVPYFEINGYKVWGATAMMLSELKTILKKLNSSLSLKY